MSCCANALRCVLLLTAFWFLESLSCHADTVTLGSGPNNPTRAGFSMMVSTERLGNTGMQPVKLSFVSTTGKFPGERNLQILFRPRTQYATKLDCQFSFDVTLPQGAAKYDQFVLVPQYYRWENCSVRILENGRLVGGRLGTNLAMPRSVQDWGQHVSVGIIVPRDAKSSGEAWATFPDLRSIVTVLGSGPLDNRDQSTRLKDKPARDYLEKLNHSWIRFRILDEDELHPTWLGYSQLDLILSPFPVLQRVEKSQPEQSQALQRWVSTGGEIWAYAASPSAVKSSPWISSLTSDKARLMTFRKTPGANLSLSGGNEFTEINYQPWNNGNYYSTVYSANRSSETRRGVFQKMVKDKHPMVAYQNRKALLSELDIMPFGFGRVALLSQDDPFPGSFQLWQGLENEYRHWDTRHGVNYTGGTDTYWAWLMEAVGQPPVTMFVILNGLFVVVMGPVLYFVLRKRSRLYLLYFLAPALALATTLGLFAYAFVLDGFDNRARIRQLTWIDGKNELPIDGPSTAEKRYPRIDHSRQTYYTVMDNQQGLSFETEALVLPVRFDELMNRYSYRSSDSSRPGDFQVHQSDQRTRYFGEFLPVRSQVHYLTTRPSADGLPIQFQLSDGKAKLTNLLSSELSQVVVCDEKGQFWTGERIAPQAEMTLTRSRGNPFDALMGQVIEPGSGMPSPYQNRFSSSDASAIETRLRSYARKPVPGSFMATTEVERSVIALRECKEEQCVRLIGGLLP